MPILEKAGRVFSAFSFVLICLFFSAPAQSLGATAPQGIALPQGTVASRGVAPPQGTVAPQAMPPQGTVAPQGVTPLSESLSKSLSGSLAPAAPRLVAERAIYNASNSSAAGLEDLFVRPARLHIIYSAESGGELHPCASCGGSLGGLARRAALIKKLRRQGVPLLQIIGPNEFGSSATQATPPTQQETARHPTVQQARQNQARQNQQAGQTEHPTAQQARLPAGRLRAYAALQPQAVYLSTADRRWFETAQKPLPDFFLPLEAGDQPTSRVLNYGGRKIGLVFFGKLDPPDQQDRSAAKPDQQAGQQPTQWAGQQPNQQTGQQADQPGLAEGPNPAHNPAHLPALNPAAQAALAEGRKLAGQVHLLIGVSPWGFEAERSFLPQAAGVYHILLGGGPGPNFARASHPQAEQLLWARPARGGTGLTRISLYNWPQPGSGVFWKDSQSFEAVQEFLRSSLPEDPEMLELLK